MTLPTTQAAAQIAGIAHDEATVLQTANSRLLLAAALGEIDLNTLAKAELAARGLNQKGRWVGFERAAVAWDN